MLDQALAQQGQQQQDPQALYKAMRMRQDAPPPQEPEVVEEPISPMENQVGVNPSAADRTLYVGAHRSMTMLDDLMATANTFDKAQTRMADQPIIVAGIDMAAPNDDFARIAREELIYKDPKVRDFMSRGAKLESDFSKLMAGLNLTQFEIIDRQKWSPFANGISQDARKARMGDLKKLLTEQTDIFDELYGNKWGAAVKRAKDKSHGNSNRTVLSGLTNEGLADEAEDILAQLKGLRSE